MGYLVSRSNTVGTVIGESVISAAEAMELAEQYIKNGGKDVRIKLEYALSDDEIRAQLAEDNGTE